MEPREPEKPFAEDLDVVEITDLPGHEQTKRRKPRAAWHRRRWRPLQLAGIIVLSAFCLVLILRGTPDLRSSSLFTNIFGPPPTPTNASEPNINLFYINATPPWGVLSVDGKKLAYPPDAASGRPLQLAPGSHHLTWQAAPFFPQSCVISVPSLINDSCSANESVRTPNGQEAWIVSFKNSIFTLPQSQQNALNAQIQRALDGLRASDLVHPGEQFVDLPVNGNNSTIQSPTVTAQQTLRATLRLTHVGYLQGGSCMGASTPNSCEVNGQDCRTLCTLGNQGNAWNVAAVVATSWTYTALSGRVVAANMADEPGAEIDHLLSLTINWDGTHWQVQADQQFINGPIPCVAASDQGALGDDFGTSPFQAFSWNTVPAPNPAAGCLVVLTSLVDGAPSPTASSQIVYLHRFGVFIALNRLAQEYNSGAPHPTAYELSLAHELAAQGHIALS